MEINCDELIEYEKEQCSSFYSLIVDNYDIKAELDIMLYDESDNFLFVQSASLSRTYACLDDVRM